MILSLYSKGSTKYHLCVSSISKVLKKMIAVSDSSGCLSCMDSHNNNSCSDTCKPLSASTFVRVEETANML